jgi:uroporphyrinogen-III decarboxylase
VEKAIPSSATRNTNKHGRPFQTHYAPATEAAVTNIYERLTITRLECNENASALVGRLESHFTALAHVCEKLSEAHKKSALITALDSSEHTIQPTDGEGLPNAT